MEFLRASQWLGALGTTGNGGQLRKRGPVVPELVHMEGPSCGPTGP